MTGQQAGRALVWGLGLVLAVIGAALAVRAVLASPDGILGSALVGAGLLILLGGFTMAATRE